MYSCPDDHIRHSSDSGFDGDDAATFLTFQIARLDRSICQKSIGKVTTMLQHCLDHPVPSVPVIDLTIDWDCDSDAETLPRSSTASHDASIPAIDLRMD
ncbi:hypothetical protein HNY73_007338 [Argiope bruennichi]|uniref:Uncharacterized protein n=1 Tax=Argiope bruennichi TaxID=94029 RepID=A0A8T0FGP3_ARGBR|nr:hypothetical protein HNY73_007338 [Argiope bruennichi]